VIVCRQNALTYPLDTSQLYWITLTGRSGMGTNFFFASDDGSRLTKALDDLPRFTAALQDAIAQFSVLPCATILQDVYDTLIAQDSPPPLRFPAVGDTNVRGKIIRIFGGKFWRAVPNRNPDGTRAPGTHREWGGTIWIYLAANGYSTPCCDWPSYSAGSFIVLTFISLTELCDGQEVLFDIATGNAEGTARAANVRAYSQPSTRERNKKELAASGWPAPGDTNLLGTAWMVIHNRNANPAAPWLCYIDIDASWWGNGIPDPNIVANFGYPSATGNPLRFIGWSSVAISNGQSVLFDIDADGNPANIRPA
jgi:hypothetical protein